MFGEDLLSLSGVNIIRLLNSKISICDTVKPVTFTQQLPATACMSDDTGPCKKDAEIGKKSSFIRTRTYRMTWCTAKDWLLCNCCHLLTGQRFSRGHLGSFIAGTEDSRRTLKM
jgi:hypothetical protein